MKDIDKAAREKCTLSDAELTEKSRAIIRDTSATYGKAWKMSIPPMPNHDSDFILSELVDRFISRQSEIDELIDELIEALEEATRWIPAEEELPVKYRSVLVKPKKGGIEVSHRDTHATGSLKWYLVPLGVTHWRPIDTPKATQLLEKYGKK